MLSTHVLDTSRGMPAGGVEVVLFRSAKARTEVGRARTDANGRIKEFDGAMEAGWYELVFFVAPYFAGTGAPAFYDEITIRFRIDAGEEHYHVPLLVSPWGYTTYRGG